MVRVEIPRELEIAIAKVQAEYNLDHKEACNRAAELIIFNHKKIKKEICLRAEAIHRSRFMSELNKGRQTIRNKAWKDGVNWVRHNEDNFRVPCSICGKPMTFSSNYENWKEVCENLFKAFKSWHHISCRTESG